MCQSTCGKRSKGFAFGPLVGAGAGCAACGAGAGGFAVWVFAGACATGASACSGIP